MSTARHMTTWTRSWTNDEGVTSQHELPIDVSGFGPGTTLWRFDPPLKGHEYALICDRGWLLGISGVAGEAEMGVSPDTTEIPEIVQVFGANEDGSPKSMTTICDEPISLSRPRDGIRINEIIRALKYTPVED